MPQDSRPPDLPLLGKVLHDIRAMHPRTPTLPRSYLFDEADDEDLILACASSGCSSCISYFDVEDARAAASPHALRRPQRRHRPHPHRARR